MIRLPAGNIPLSAPERYALDTLVDLSRLLPAEAGDAPVVEVHLADDTSGPGTLASHVASGWGISAGSGVVRVPRSALRIIADTAGAGTEQRSQARDRHGRVPSGENPLVSAGLERQPVVSRAAALFREAVIAAAGHRPIRLLPAWPEGRQWAVAVTHDLDAVEWWPLFTGQRLLELGRKGELRLAGRALSAAARSIGGDPLGNGVRALLAAEARAGLHSTWFVLCGTPSLRTILAGDLTYRPEAARTGAALGAIGSAGHEIGLHGSFETGAVAGAFEKQRRRLAALTAQEIVGVRQHFIKMDPGITQRSMSAAGFGYDATYGFPDRNGFRLGVADVVAGWDEERQHESPLMEVPLCWMDRALSKYQGIERPDAWIDDALELASTVREVGGLWVGLWHPNLTAALGYPGAPDAFARLLLELARFEPYIARMEDLVAWRRARRSVRARAVSTDGGVTAISAQTSVPIRLLDARGNPAEDVGR